MTTDEKTDLDALESLLRWYAAMGVDAAIDEAPHDRFVVPAPVQEKAARVAPAVDRQQVPAPAAAPASADESVSQAAAFAIEAKTLDDLRARWSTLPGLGLTASARMILAGGAPGARLMLIGAAPNSDDERRGEIFAGAAGRLLDAMLRAIGLNRSSVYLANLVPWRPPGNRPPTPLELALCLPFARRHIVLAAPEIILCLGERAAQPLLGSGDPISKLRGRWLAYEGETATVKLLATFSLAYLLSQPLQKRRAWTDLQMLMAELGRRAGDT